MCDLNKTSTVSYKFSATGSKILLWVHTSESSAESLETLGSCLQDTVWYANKHFQSENSLGQQASALSLVYGAPLPEWRWELSWVLLPWAPARAVHACCCTSIVALAQSLFVPVLNWTSSEDSKTSLPRPACSTP